jgi:replication fork protection complex subunit Csm3/Swi3
MARLLNTYQLWLDDLFPKAKFMDGISMIEKLGHKKRIQMMRREWIEEGKPKPQRHEDEEDDANNHNQTPSGQEEPDEDQLDALLAESETISPSTTPKTTNAQPANDQEEPDQDELDALMAEDAMNETTTTAAAPKSLFGGPPSLATSTTRRPPDVDNFDDDEEAMAGMDW